MPKLPELMGAREVAGAPKPTQDEIDRVVAWMRTQSFWLGAYEVAERLVIDSRNIGRQAGMPEPVQVLRATRLWAEPDIDALVQERKRLGRQQ